ncbi:MAG: pyridoxamine 5'-phosphate oxidase [Acidimicrobiia bacterium]
MVQLEDFSRLAVQQDGLVMVGATRADGTVQATVVNAGVFPHPADGGLTVAMVVRGNALKLRLVRRRPACTVTVRNGFQWVTVEGSAEVAGPDDPHPAVPNHNLPGLLRAVYMAAGGSHDDWPTYDKVMAEERRTVIFVRPQRVYGMVRY